MVVDMVDRDNDDGMFFMFSDDKMIQIDYDIYMKSGTRYIKVSRFASHYYVDLSKSKIFNIIMILICLLPIVSIYIVIHNLSNGHIPKHCLLY